MTIILQEYPTIGGVDFGNPAYFCTDMSDLRMPARQRGANRAIPHGSVIAKRKRNTATERTMPFVIDGSVDTSGAATGNYFSGVDTHLAYIRANVVAPVGSAPWTRAATLVLASGTLTANVQVTELERGQRSGPLLYCTLHLIVMGPGQFA